MSINRRKVLLCTAAAALLAPGLALAQAKSDIKLPNTLVWTAYDVGSSGYAQAVGIGSIMKNTVGTNLRVLPGKNDVSRLAPLREGTAQFSATGSDNVYSQEAVFTFGEKEWGPQPIRLLMQNYADGAAVALATAADANIKTLKDVKGKRVAWIRGAPALNQAVTCMLAYAGLTWDDVVKVEFGGHGPAVDGMVNNEVDAFNNATFSALNQKIAASPRGIYYPPVPHSDEEGWKRLQAVVPWYEKIFATDGVGIKKEGQEMAGVAYPVLVSYDKIAEDVAYNVTKAMHKFYDDYKASAPGANGWALEPVAPRADTDPPVPAYAYTIGVPALTGFAEIAVFGLTPVATNGLVGLVIDALRGGTEIPTGVELVGLLDNELRCAFAPVDLDVAGDLFATARSWYRGEPYELVQLVYPDRNGFMPYEPGFDQRMRFAQPLVGSFES